MTSPSDTVASLSRALSPEGAVKWAVVARDPWLLGLLEPKSDVVEALAEAAPLLAASASGLVGEIFREEERALTRPRSPRSCTRRGCWRSPKRPTLRVCSPSSPRWASSSGVGCGGRGAPGSTTGTGRASSRCSQPSRREGGEAGLKPPRETISSLLGVEAQFFVGELLAEATGLERAYSISGSRDVDVVLVKGGKAVAGYEVKLGSFSSSEASRAVERIRSLGIPRAGLVSLTEEPLPAADELYGPRDLERLAREVSERRKPAYSSIS